MNHYQKILVKLDQLIINKKYSDALMIINEELQSPYLPNDFSHKLLKLNKEITFLIYEKNDNLDSG
jgi:hypothetical protein